MPNIKPTLYYALVSSWSPRNPSSGFQVLEVTSEKGRQVYGRDESGAVTHRAERDVIYRFPPGTLEAYARAAHQRAEKTRSKWRPRVTAANTRYEKLSNEMNAAILRAARGEP